VKNHNEIEDLVEYDYEFYEKYASDADEVAAKDLRA
jgi:hypothetical protein